MRNIIRCFPVLLVSVWMAMPGLAANSGADKMKACASAWNAMSTAAKKATTYQQYSADCLSRKTVATQSSTPQERMKTCASEWEKLKAAGRTGNETYQQYSAHCLKN
jgi:hypothetical protein